MLWLDESTVNRRYAPGSTISDAWRTEADCPWTRRDCQSCGLMHATACDVKWCLLNFSKGKPQVSWWRFSQINESISIPRLLTLINIFPIGHFLLRSRPPECKRTSLFNMQKPIWAAQTACVSTFHVRSVTLPLFPWRSPNRQETIRWT